HSPRGLLRGQRMGALFSTTPCAEIEISGTAVAWIAFGLAMGQDGAAIPSHPDGSTAPYAHAATRIHVVHRKRCKLAIEVRPTDDIVLAGDPSFLRDLAETVNIFGTQFEKGTHIHIDYQGDDHWVDERSVSTVFMHEGAK